MKLQKRQFSWIFTGGIIFIFMLLYSTLLMLPNWNGYLMLGLPTLIMACGRLPLYYSRDAVDSLNRQEILLWIIMAVLFTCAEAVILFLRQFPMDILLIEGICLCFSILFLLEEEMIEVFRKDVSQFLSLLLRLFQILPVLMYCLLVVLQSEWIAYVYLVITMVVVCADFFIIQYLQKHVNQVEA